MNLDKTLKDYYSKRAREYDAIYHRKIPLRLREQERIAKEIKRFFKNKYVLEIACGTGYWTKYLVGSARKTIATDISLEMLKVAANTISSPSIQFILGDAYNPPLGIPLFSGAMAHAWFSHIPKKRIKPFLKSLHKNLEPGARIMFMDAVYREELGGKLIKKKGIQDTWKRRKLKNNKEYDILKNYYTKEELISIFSKYSNDVSVIYLTNFWIVEYKLPKK